MLDKFMNSMNNDSLRVSSNDWRDTGSSTDITEPLSVER